ncbi:ABC transporter permease [Parapedobacter deserti]|uniref:ABC transporter permease n=1 Tax=Parapedobacter deserti TaxID=1912957 RepID=A0ABV7JFK5_9SPHI
MIKQHLKTAWRNIIKNKLYALLNIFGLGLGIACCLFLFLYITFHLSFDNYHPQAETTYRLVNELHFETTEYSKGASYAMYTALKSEMPEVDKAAFLLSNQAFTIRIGEQLYHTGQRAALTSSEWFKLFDFPWLKGNPKELDEANTLALTRKAARQYFGDTDPIGQVVLVESKHPFKVVGIVDDSCTNTSLGAELYLSFTSIKTLQPGLFDDFFTAWGYINSSNTVFVSLHDTSQKDAVERRLNRMTVQHFGEETARIFNFKLLPLTDTHFDTRYGGTVQRPLLLVLAIIGGCIMVVAGINYVNLSIAHQARRATEIGTRKILGGSRRQLFAQFMTESTFVTLTALCIALILIYLMLPLANQYLLFSEPIQVLSWYRFSAFSIGFWIVVSVAAGAYPAYLLGRLNVFDALKNRLPIRNRTGRQALVVLQNVVAQVILMATIVIVLQVRFLRHTDVGFDRESVVTIPLPKTAGDGRDAIGQYLDSNPRVAAFSFCFQPPASRSRYGGTVRFDEREAWETWPARYVYVDSAYVHTFGIQLVAGRNIRQDAAMPEYLISELMVSKLGFDNADDVLGKPLLAGGMNDEMKGVVVGVMRDFNTQSLLTPIEPTLAGFKADMQTMLAVKLATKDVTGIVADLQGQWKTHFPDAVFEYHFLDEQIEALYEKEILQQRLIWITAAVAVIICVLGLLGMVSLMTQLRIKEIGIRKVLGASMVGIVRLLSTDFVKLVLIAVVVALPVAWWIMSKWLEDFPYRIDIQWWMFASAGAVAVAIALATVSWQAVRAALANPVKSLRDE